MPNITGDFPFEEIRTQDGNYFDTAAEAIAAGHAETQVWSVIEASGHKGQSVIVYGPSRHYINRLGYVATAEHHDDNTYYFESWV